MPTQAKRQTTVRQYYHGQCPTSNATEQGEDGGMGGTGWNKKSSSRMGDQSQRSQHRTDAAGVNIRHTRDWKHGGGGPNLGSPRGLPHHTHNEQALELGASVPTSDGSTIAGTAQNHPGPVHGNQPWAYNHKPPKSSHQSPGARHRNTGMHGRWRIGRKHHYQGHMHYPRPHIMGQLPFLAVNGGYTFCTPTRVTMETIHRRWRPSF